MPNSQIVRIHASSGTTGKPTVVGYTRRDIDVWSECVARCISMAGLGKNDIIQVAYGYGLFTGGLGAHYGAEKMGATVVPMSTGNTKKLINMMIDFGVTGIMCTPSYLLHIAETIEEMGVRDQIKLKASLNGAERGRRRCGTRSRRSWASRPTISTASARSWAWRGHGLQPALRTACTRGPFPA